MPNLRDVGFDAAIRGPVGSMANEPEVMPDPSREKRIQFIAAALKRMRFFRRQYDIRRAHYYRQYLGQRDERFYPDNVTKRSNTFVPYPFSNVEQLLDRVMDAFFSMEEYFEVKEKPPYSGPDEADAMQLTLQDKLHKAQFIQAFETFVRNVLIYGHAGIKIDWDFSKEVIVYREPVYAQQPVVDPMTGQPAIDPQTGQPQMQPLIGMDGQPVIQGFKPAMKEVPKAMPRFQAIDAYDLLVDPDGAYVAHLTERTWRDLREENENHPERFLPDGMTQLESRLKNEENPDEIIIRLAEFWNENDNTWTIMTFGEDPEGISFKDLRASFRATSYSPYKRRLYGGETIMLWDGPNPFMHKRAPILHTSYVKIPNEVFGLGAIEIITDLSEALNRFTNMIADNWNLGINHRYAYDINAEIDHEALNSFNVPGGKVGVVGNPQEVIFPLPQFTPATGDYQILEIYRGMIEMASGLSDFYSKGVGQPSSNKTATGIQSIIGETNYRIKAFIRSLELDVMQPILEMCASMVQQFVTEPFPVQNQKAAPGEPPVLMVDPVQLIGSYSYNLVAANYATSKFVRQRNFMALANVINQSPYVNQREALVELLKVFEIKHVNRIVKSEEQVQMEQQQQMEQQLQMMLLEHELDVDKGARKPPSGFGANGKAPPGKGKRPKAGRPPKAQFEGRIPGAGLSSMVRGMGQSQGANALGLEGTGEVPEHI